LNGEDEAAREATRAVLYHVLLGILKLLHPFMPFLTDEVYRHLPRAQGDPGSIMIAPWPEQPERMYPEDAARMEGVMEVIRAIRNLRAEMNVQAGKRASLILRPREGWKDVLAASEQYFKRLAYTTQLELIGPESPNPDKAASAVTVPCELFIPLGELVDIDRELARLGKDKKTMEAEIARGEGKLKNEGFLKKAPQALVQAEQEKLATNRQVLLALEERIRELSALA
ncbi:MAG: class I tRNA ligase family protein, partial [Clostridiales bacterium]|nr:class I tRNA ligase family protein [Clostridiales bacterium]